MGTPSVELNARSEAIADFGPTAAVEEVTLQNSEPASLTMLSPRPPANLSVGQPFLMRVLVRTTSGQSLNSVRVDFILSQPSGAFVNTFDYLVEAFKQPPLTDGPDSPSLELPASAVSNRKGVVRVVLKLATGATGSVRSLIAQSGDIRSPRSKPFVVSNPIKSIVGQNFSVDRTGLNGIGDPNSFDVRVLRKPVQDFPVSVSLPQLSVRVQLAADNTSVPDSLAPNLVFRIFTKGSLEEMAEVRQLQEEQKAQLRGKAQQIGEGFVETGSVEKESAIGVFSTLTSLLFTGAVRLVNYQVNGTQEASIQPGYKISQQPLPDGSIDLTIRHVSMLVRKPGDYRLQVTVMGIQSNIFGKVDVARYADTSWQAILLNHFVQWATAFAVCIMAIGCGGAHRPRRYHSVDGTRDADVPDRNGR